MSRELTDPEIDLGTLEYAMQVGLPDAWDNPLAPFVALSDPPWLAEASFHAMAALRTRDREMTASGCALVRDVFSLAWSKETSPYVFADFFSNRIRGKEDMDGIYDFLSMMEVALQHISNPPEEMGLAREIVAMGRTSTLFKIREAMDKLLKRISSRGPRPSGEQAKSHALIDFSNALTAQSTRGRSSAAIQSIRFVLHAESYDFTWPNGTILTREEADRRYEEVALSIARQIRERFPLERIGLPC